MIWHVDKPPFYQEHKELKYTPTNVAIAPSGDIYFADGYGSWFIHHLDKNGNYKETFGGPGDGNTATIHPHGLYCDVRGKEPLVVVARTIPKAKSQAGCMRLRWIANITAICRRRCARLGISIAGKIWW